MKIDNNRKRVPYWKKTLIFFIPFLIIRYVIRKWVPMEYTFIQQLPYLFILGSLAFWWIIEKKQLEKEMTPPANTESVKKEIQSLVKQEEPISAIQLARKSLGLSSMVAKEYVDNLIELEKNKK